MNNYRLPATKKEKAELIKAMLRGDKTIYDLLPRRTEVWYEDIENNSMYQTQPIPRRLTIEEYNKMVDDTRSPVLYITVGWKKQPEGYLPFVNPASDSSLPKISDYE